MQLRMDGKNAVITGGSLGIGRAIATRFVEAGANVAIVARRAEVLEEARAAIGAAGNGKVVAISTDVSTADGCAHAFSTAMSEFGQVDILVNNAGTSKRGAFESITDEEWQTDLDLKLFAAVRMCRQALPGMKSRKWGRVINVLNTGSKAPPAEGAPTAVTRAAGLSLTKILSAEGAAHNVLVNALLVGRIESNQWEVRHAAETEGRSLEAYYEEAGKVLPMGRFGTAQEFANVACFLASDAGSYVTGTAINVDGGMCPVV